MLASLFLLSSDFLAVPLVEGVRSSPQHISHTCSHVHKYSYFQCKADQRRIKKRFEEMKTLAKLAKYLLN